MGCIAFPLVMGPAIAFALTHIRPVCRFVHRAMKVLRVHKGLHEHHGIAEEPYPVGAHALLAQGQDPRAEVGYMPLG